MWDHYLPLLPMGLVTGLAGWFGNAWLEARKASAAIRRAELEATATIQGQRDGLTFELLDAARSELGQMRQEVEKLRPMESHLYHLQQALEHLELILNADPESRAHIERQARAFLNRMRRLEEAKGTIANEVQRVDSTFAVNQVPAKEQD